MALRITEQWIRERVKLKHDNLDDVKSLSLPGTYHEKISSLGTSLSGFTRLKSLDLSRNALISTEGLQEQHTLESLNLYYNNICSLKDLYGLQNLTNLKDLDLRLNPVTKNEPDYRLFIVHMLPNLRQLDDRSVRDSERRAAIMHFTSDQASDFDRHYSSNSKMESERVPLPRSEMIRKLASQPTVLEDDDVAVLDLISRTGGDLSQPRGISGSSAQVPDVGSYTRDELHKIFPPVKHKAGSRNPSSQGTSDVRPQKDRAYVHFADNDVRLSDDPNLKYRDETDAYTTISTRGHFMPNPKMTSYNPSPRQPYNPPTLSSTEHVRPEDLSSDKSRGDVAGLRERVEDKSVPLSARSYELSPSRKRQSSSPRQSQGPLADKIGKGSENVVEETPTRGLQTKLVTIEQSGQVEDQGMFLNKLLDLVDKYWNGSKSLHRHSKFQSLAQRLVSSHLPATVGSQDHTASHSIDKLQRQLNERTAEISRMRDQMSQQQRELEQVRSNFKSQGGIKESLDATAHNVATERSRRMELQEENNSLRSKITALEVVSHGATEQEKVIGELQQRNLSLQEQVKNLNQQVQQQKINLQQLQELTNMLQESHRSLVSTNDHLLRELDEVRQRHQHEVHQMHWSYDNLKKTIDWIPNNTK
ncbi:unnamed protein product [Porites evermanni]|uniref:U2A'/phosphoprotein 32 family A C-terminal domain-containing protein n=1 Tax=Porites evermanni TaxID=104178 RepID=A0ABN8N032_9CNID|nr:unnamed protein product [Porites evermanni]